VLSDGQGRAERTPTRRSTRLLARGGAILGTRRTGRSGAAQPVANASLAGHRSQGKSASSRIEGARSGPARGLSPTRRACRSSRPLLIVGPADRAAVEREVQAIDYGPAEHHPGHWRSSAAAGPGRSYRSPRTGHGDKSLPLGTATGSRPALILGRRMRSMDIGKDRCPLHSAGRQGNPVRDPVPCPGQHHGTRASALDVPSLGGK